MTHPKNIQIDLALFSDLCGYILDHADSNDPRFDRIMHGLSAKLDAMRRHELYSKYKTASTIEDRSIAREHYLREINFPIPS